MISNTITNKSTKIFLQLYKSLVRPHLEYCTAAWSPHYQKGKKTLEKVQTWLKHLNLWTLEDRRIRADLIEVVKMVHGLSVVDDGTISEFDKSN